MLDVYLVKQSLCEFQGVYPTRSRSEAEIPIAKRIGTANSEEPPSFIQPA